MRKKFYERNSQYLLLEKGRKVNKVIDAMSDIHDMQKFKNMFKEMYPDDWKK